MSGTNYVVVIAAGFSVLAVAMLGCVSEAPGEAAVVVKRLDCPSLREYPVPEDPLRGMTWVPEGTFIFGAGALYPEEFPAREAKSGGFWMLTSEVTNAAFGAFVDATGYETEAEAGPSPMDHPDVEASILVPGGAVFVAPGQQDNEPMRGWWQFRHRANWRNPDGTSNIPDNFDQLPVVQITYKDAMAYADWLGHDLPTEIEWEYAARGGGGDTVYAWGDELMPADTPLANHWQGSFPSENAASDGFEGAAPPGCFPPNGFGLYDMIGNVWELTSSHYTENRAPDSALSVQHVTMKGGSFLCAPNYCQRYRPAARQPQDIALTTNHAGFRTILRGKPERP